MRENKAILNISLAVALLFAAGYSVNSTTSSNPPTENSEGTPTVESTTASSVDLNTLELPQLAKDVAGNEDLVEMATNKGIVKIKLFPEHAPKTVKSFMTHAKDGYHSRLTLRHVIKNFMIQGDDPKSDGIGGESIWGEGFETEISNHLYNIRGALPMAHSQDPDSSGSQFFIVQNIDDIHDSLLKDDYSQVVIDAYKNGGHPSPDSHYTIFGQVIKRMDIMDAIADIEIDSSDKPKEEVKINKINILQKAKQK